MSDMSTTGASASLLRRFLIVLAGLFLLLVLVLFGAYFYINLRGDREWEAFRAEWEQKGEKFEIKDFIPASVPDDQNFASTPLLAALVDFSKAPGSPVVWNNLQLKDRASAIGALLQNPGRRKTPNAGQWQLAAPVDLVQWHQFLSADSSEMPSDASAAARGVLSVLKQFDSELDELTAPAAGLTACSGSITTRISGCFCRIWLQSGGFPKRFGCGPWRDSGPGRNRRR